MRDQDVDSTGVALAGALFGFATPLSAVGLLAALIFRPFPRRRGDKQPLTRMH